MMTLVVPLALAQSALAGEAYSNSWILPAYAAGQKTDFDYNDTLTPPIGTFFPPMAGWCLGKTAKIGVPLAHNLGEAPAAPIHFLGNASLDDKVQADQVQVCLSGYTARPPAHDQQVTQILNLGQDHRSELQQLRGEISSLKSQQAALESQFGSLQSQIGSLRGELAGAMAETRRIVAELGNRLISGETALRGSQARVSMLEAENSNLRAQLSTMPR